MGVVPYGRGMGVVMGQMSREWVLCHMWERNGSCEMWERTGVSLFACEPIEEGEVPRTDEHKLEDELLVD